MNKTIKKANLFSNILKNTFSDQNEEKFDKNNKKKIGDFVNNHDFGKHEYNNKNCFSWKELNNIIKNLNSKVKNMSQEFRLIFLSLINLTIKKIFLWYHQFSRRYQRKLQIVVIQKVSRIFE